LKAGDQLKEESSNDIKHQLEVLRGNPLFKYTKKSLALKGLNILCPPQKPDLKKYKNYQEFKNLLIGQNGVLYSTKNLKINYKVMYERE
jgi:hypothetical protein